MCCYFVMFFLQYICCSFHSYVVFLAYFFFTCIHNIFNFSDDLCDDNDSDDIDTDEEIER